MADQEGINDDGDGSAEANAFVSSPRRVSRLRQFSAVVRKNLLLQTRASKAWYTFRLTGWAALLLEIAVPGIFFALTCIPKIYLNPVEVPQQLTPPYALDATKWALDYDGPAKVHEYRALLLFAPNTTAGEEVMAAFARSVACPEDSAKKAPMSSSFYAMFRQPIAQDECTPQYLCLSNANCSAHLQGTQIIGFETVEEALDRASSRADTVDAVIALEGLENPGFTDVGYTVRVNHTTLPSTRGKLDTLSVQPGPQYKEYWLFANLQFHLDRAIIGLATDRDAAQPAALEADIKPFPWPAGSFDPGAAFAAVAFNLLLVFAFLVPTRSMTATIVREKELRLREGMRILGLRDAAYWGSWVITHFSTLGTSMLLCALISLYPFPHSSFSVLLVILWMVAAALIAFAYFLSTLFSKSRVAGIAASMLYALAMVPGYLMPTLQPYGGWGWYCACLFPPSAVSLFANVLVKVEAGGLGLQWESLGRDVTSESSFPFSSRFVLVALLVDCVLYSLLTAYCDKVVPSDVGTSLPWNFPFKRSFWRKGSKRGRNESLEASTQAAERLTAAPELAVSINKLRKVFWTTEGASKAAVDGLSVDILKNEITALLGANGAGKTTTISILTGMLQPTDGTAFVNGYSILDEMDAIRQDLGVCPQFDILWPEITVREHLELYAAIKGYSPNAGRIAATSAAEEVGLGQKLDSLAENLSGGQRRKLSVAIAFLGSPAIVILDEPTSGMDPYSRRFTWEIIKRHREGHAIVLTTHSMEEADLLSDKIAIMADGRLAAGGSPLDLKKRFGVGYRLTVVKRRSGQDSTAAAEGQDRGDGDDLRHVPSQQSISELSDGDAEVDGLVSRHITGAQLIGRGASEMVFRLPKEDSRKFPELLRELDSVRDDLGVSSYGLSETTLEEVFLAVTSKAAEAVAVDAGRGEALESGGGDVSVAVEDESTALLNGAGDFDGDSRRPTRVLGARLFLQQLWALLVKRAISAKRDRMAVWTQLAVPVLLVLVALLSGRATISLLQEPALVVSRDVCEFKAPTVLGATAEARGNVTALTSFTQNYGAASLVDSREEKVWQGPFLMPPEGTLDGFLLDTWGSSRASYDALFISNWSNTLQVASPGQPVRYTLLVNQTATHAVPAALRSMSAALLRAVTGNRSARLSVTNHPLPSLPNESAIEVSRETGDLLLVLFTIMASTLLSSSFALFLVRERENSSKSVQMISGAPSAAFWLANLFWDLVAFSCAAAGILVCYAAFQIPQFQGPRLGAFVVLLWMFGVASIPFTYLLHFAFTDEMKALQRINSLSLLCGYLGFLTTWILDVVYMLLHKGGVRTANLVTQRILRLLSPHFNLARGMYEVASTHQEGFFSHDSSPWTWTATGQWVTFMAVQGAVFGALTLLVEAGWLDSLAFKLNHVLLVPLFAACSLFRRQEAAEPEGWPEDEDVSREAYRIQDGRGEREGDQVILAKLRKDYSQGLTRPLIHAVRNVSLGVSQGECFGLLGVNGAGKTTTFRILTGEVIADAGDAKVCGHSVRSELSEARRSLGYCPQFSALPGSLTGREVLRMYARLRGVPGGLIEGSVQSLLKRLDLCQYADRACESYSGGNKRKLSVGVALVGSPPVVMLDEPSTGMDPGAKRFLWDVIQRQVIDQGHTVLLTSHSMEECEALCTKIGMMRGGGMRCLGSVQHLKNRFGAGYVLALRLEQGQEAEPVSALLEDVCPQTTLLQSEGGHMSFKLPQEGLDLPLLFEKMEASRQELGIEEYSVSQATLEHVFVQLAQQ